MKVGYIILNEFLHARFSIPMFASQKSKEYNADRCRNPLRFCETAPIRPTVSYSRIIPRAVCQCPRGWFQMEKPPMNSCLQYFACCSVDRLSMIYFSKKVFRFFQQTGFPTRTQQMDSEIGQGPKYSSMWGARDCLLPHEKCPRGQTTFLIIFPKTGVCAKDMCIIFSNQHIIFEVSETIFRPVPL